MAVASRSPGRMGRTLAVAGLVLGAVPAMAQIPDEFKNLKVLPRDISKGELVELMRGFAGGLGVRCAHCHVGPDNLQGMDFATDEKEPKRVARAMLKMTREINDKLLPAAGREDPARVACSTCHRGLTDPRSLAEVVLEVAGESGAEAAASRYRELRDEYHGSGSYDFGPGTLNHVAETLAAGEGGLGSAILLQRLNLEFHPQATYSHLLLGRLLAARGDREAAILAIERALELEPDNRWAMQLLERVRSKE